MDKCALRKLNLNALNLEAVKAVENCQKSEAYLLRVIEVVSELIAAVESGKVSLSKAKKICSVISPKNHKEWIDLATYETSRVIEKCVAEANPKEAVKESAQYKSADRIEFKLGVSEVWMELLATTKDLLSQKQSRAVTSEEALFFVMNEFNERHNPVKKAERAMTRSQNKSKEQCPGTVELQKSAVRKPLKRTPLKRFTIHTVNHRDQGQCTYVSKIGRCEQKRFLDHHHIIPVSHGGTNDTENLTTLCHAHHKMHHRRLCSSKTHNRPCL